MAPLDECYASTYIFDAVCPLEGKGAALVLPFCNTAGMNLRLAEISWMVSPGRHAVLLLVKVGWHLSGEVALPAKYPKLNMMENVWQFICDNWLSNQILQNCDDIVGHCSH